MTDEALLKHLARYARTHFKLHVWQWLPKQPVSGHAPGSLHYATFPGSNVGRAFDAYRSAWRQARFARWLRRRHKSRLTECIYNGRFTKVSIKNGVDVPPSFWGPVTWAEHTNHVHVAI